MKHKNWDLPVIPAALPKEKSKKKKKSALDVMLDDQDLYVSLQGYREDEWRTTVLAFEANQSVHNAYYYVARHPMFWYFTKSWKDGRAPRVHERHLSHEEGWKQVHIEPHLVNPVDKRISDDKSLNTLTQFWWEFGPTLFREDAGSGISGHDWKCDGGADSADEAIIGVAKKIHSAYGNDRRQVVKKWNDPELPKEADK